MIDTALFVLAKVAGLVLRPDSWIALALVMAFWAGLRGRHRLATRLAGWTLAAILAIGVLPLGDLMLRPLETRYPVRVDIARLDGILVLGGGEDAHGSVHWGQVQLGEGGERLTEGLRLARAHPDARLVFAGGSGSLRDASGSAVSEASVAERFFADHGITRAEFERSSRNTTENARAIRAMLGPRTGETWVLVTSAFHMPRALQSFRAAGWSDLEAWPVDHRGRALDRGFGWNLDDNLRRIRTAIGEYTGLMAYRLLGR